jgi:hypothetical protein
MRQRLRCLWEEFTDILLDMVRVLYVDGDKPIQDEEGNYSYNYLWQYASKMRIIDLFQHRRNAEGTEQFSPITILRTVDVKTSAINFVAPLTFTLGKGYACIAFNWWAWWQVSFDIQWENLR